MKLIFRGVRGSIPTPGPGTVKYGGNTTCIEIRTASNELIILDAGTGIHALAQRLNPRETVNAHIFITHTHWDHIQGLPFFMPIFMPNNLINIYGGIDPVTNEGIQRSMGVQLQYSFFPIREAELKAKLNYHTLLPGKTVSVGEARITPTLLNHPVLNFGYRIDCDGQSLFFTGDYEPVYNIYSPEDPDHDEYQSYVEAKLAEVAQAMSDVDALIVDASYTDEEYRSKQGWGHGTYRSALSMAAQAHAKKLFLTHHDPCRSDRQLDRIHQQLQQENRDAPFDILMAREGIEYTL
ncbi:MBL fold metallo-hydrolase [Methylomarinum sp. Ch1-1]|uniref:MBL fold metallo-hydrolase n=1 Tax=Methylomarinum roseum TaxID=3067653 RepID=A0AAU7NW28_9GAMM|nr:MBL fold metallo-hydrolase [Methylomarinum sp. Ch1-1]MDP4522829.1 MBL fold metallo-hydrolase [Methylomarinum sp. Ch1-1]